MLYLISDLSVLLYPSLSGCLFSSLSDFPSIRGERFLPILLFLESFLLQWDSLCIWNDSPEMTIWGFVSASLYPNRQSQVALLPGRMWEHNHKNTFLLSNSSGDRRTVSNHLCWNTGLPANCFAVSLTSGNRIVLFFNLATFLVFRGNFLFWW